MFVADSSIAWSVGLVRYEPSVTVITYAYGRVMQDFLYHCRPPADFLALRASSQEGGETAGEARPAGEMSAAEAPRRGASNADQWLQLLRYAAITLGVVLERNASSYRSARPPCSAMTCRKNSTRRSAW